MGLRICSELGVATARLFGRIINTGVFKLQSVMLQYGFDIAKQISNQVFAIHGQYLAGQNCVPVVHQLNKVVGILANGLKVIGVEE